MRFWEPIRRIFQLLEPRERHSLFVLLALVILTGLVETAGIVSVMPFLSVVVAPEAVESSRFLGVLYRWTGGADMEDFLFWLGILTLVVLTVSNTVSAVTAWALFRFTYHQGYRFGYRLLRNYLLQPYAFFLTHNTIDLGRNVYDEVPRVVTGVMLPAIQVIAKSVSVVMILALLVAIDVVLAVVTMCTFGGAYYILRTFVQRRLERARDTASRSRAATLRFASEALSGIKELKLLGNEGGSLRAYGEPALAVADADARNQIFGTVPKYLLETLAFGGILIVILFLLSRSESKAATLSIVALYAFAGYRLLPALQNIYVNFNYVQYYFPSLRLLDDHLRQATISTPLRREHILNRLPLRHHIQLSHIEFRYPTSDGLVLDDISAKIPAGSVTGIVGTTGAGKSTLLDVVLGLLQPTTGKVLVDDTMLVPENVRSWQLNIGYVPQQIYLSDGAVASNIAFGVEREEVDRDKMVRAAVTAEVHEFISRELPNGYETLVGERGIRLSGGQRQRIGIARALYRDPDILVLDEATSALDNMTELEIMNSLGALVPKKTIVLVAHRLSTLRRCDQILLLANGRISQEGTYDELLRLSALFRQLDNAGRKASAV